MDDRSEVTVCDHCGEAIDQQDQGQETAEAVICQRCCNKAVMDLSVQTMRELGRHELGGEG